MKILPCILAAAVVSLILTSENAVAGPTVYQGSGDISTVLSQFRAALGGSANGSAPGDQITGRREINWDGVSAGLTNTDDFPPSFFNVTSTRGAILSTLGNGLRVSDVDFNDVNANYGAQFDAFSPAKTFSPVGNNAVDVTFNVAGSASGASVLGFGAVFSDIDVAGSTRIEFFQGAESLGVLTAPVRSNGSGHSFLGATFSNKRITRVRIISGSGALSTALNDVTDGGIADLVTMDDFIFGEPRTDTDYDGVLSDNDVVFSSDTRSNVDVQSTKITTTRIANVTLVNGTTIQDMVNECRATQVSNRDIRRCFKNKISALKRSRLLFEDQRSLLEAVEKSLARR